MVSVSLTFSNVIAVAFFVNGARGGFLMNYPESAGYNALTEPNAPCGGAAANIQQSNMTFWDIRGGSVYLTSTYKVTDYLFRATLDANLTDGWVNLLPVLQQNGIGDYCQPSVPVPESFNGQTGILQVIANTTDGLFYQCAVLMFQSATSLSPQGGCKNGSSVFSEYVTNDAGLNMIANSSVELSGSAMTSISSMSMSSSSTMTSMSMMSTTMPSSTMAMSTTAMPNIPVASNNTAMPSGSHHSLSGGAIAGVTIGAVAAISFLLLLALFCWRNSGRRDGIIHEKPLDIETTPKKFAAELSGERGSHSNLGLDSTAGPYSTPWAPTGFQSSPIVKPKDTDSAADSRSATAASGRLSGYSDLSASAGSSALVSSTSTPTPHKEQLRAEIQRVRKQRQRLEELNALSEKEEELERELMKDDP